MDPCRGEERGCGARSPSLAFVPRSWRRPRGPSQGHKEPGRRRCAVWALHPQLGCLTEQGPWSQSQSVSFYSLTGSSWRASPHPPPHPRALGRELKCQTPSPGPREPSGKFPKVLHSDSTLRETLSPPPKLWLRPTPTRLLDSQAGLLLLITLKAFAV